MRLIDGAEAIRGDLPRAATTTVHVPLEAGDDLGSGVARCSSLTLTNDLVREALVHSDDWVLSIGGDCSAELVPVARCVERWGDELAILWLDAHADLNNPTTSQTGAFTEMVLRTLSGDGCAELTPPTPLHPSRIVLAGTRSIDPGEAAFIAEQSIRTISVDEFAQPENIIAAIDSTGASHVYIHVDLDVLDPSEIDGINDPVPFGVSAERLISAIAAVKHRYTVVGAGVTSFAPSSPAHAADDLPTILRIIGALTSDVHPA
jgi:arginase